MFWPWDKSHCVEHFLKKYLKSSRGGLEVERGKFQYLAVTAISVDPILLGTAIYISSE